MTSKQHKAKKHTFKSKKITFWHNPFMHRIFVLNFLSFRLSIPFYNPINCKTNTVWPQALRYSLTKTELKNITNTIARKY